MVSVTCATNSIRILFGIKFRTEPFSGIMILRVLEIQWVDVAKQKTISAENALCPQCIKTELKKASLDSVTNPPCVTPGGPERDA